MRSLIGRSQQVDTQKGVVTDYVCASCCPNSYQAVLIKPNPEPSPSTSQDIVAVGQAINFIAVEQQSTCSNEFTQGPPQFVNQTAAWSSNDTNIATVISTSGVVTAAAPGTTTIRATWTARSFAPIGGTCHQVAQFNVTAQRTVQVKPAVASLKASVPKTHQVGTDDFTTINPVYEFATNSTDLAVAFKGGDPITVQAQEINPASAAGSIKWKIERDSSSVDAGLPTLSSASGSSTEITPNQAGNFRLIAWYDLNNNGNFDPPSGNQPGEELKVLKLAIVRVTVDSQNCSMTTHNGFTAGPHPLGISIASDANITGSCRVILQSGGSGETVGLDKIKTGEVANATNVTFRATFQPGTFLWVDSETDSPLPAIDDISSSTPSGGDTLFRKNNDEAISSNPGGGQVRIITFDYLPDTAFPTFHIDNQSEWASTTGGNHYLDFVLGYSETFSNSYALFASAVWEVNFDGVPNEMGDWTRNNAFISIQGNLPPSNETSSYSYTSSVDGNGAITSGNNSSIRVTGHKLVIETEWTN